MQGNTAVPQAGVKVYADGNVMGVSDENGKVICRFEHAGDYVLTTGDELHTYQPVPRPWTEKPFKATVTVRLTGVNGIGAIDRTLEVSSLQHGRRGTLQQGLRRGLCPSRSAGGYIGSLTGPEDFNAANAAVAYWGQYYFVNGAYDTSSPLTVPVTAGGIYGVFANESTADSDSYYGYKYNVWFHETALTAAASETFTATVYQMGTGVAPAEGVQIFCGGELLGRTAADGTFAWHFDTAGVYVLTTGDSNHTYSQCVVTVTGKAPVCDGGANCPSRAFPDLDPAQWYHLSTDYAITNHLFIGFEDGTFPPERPDEPRDVRHGALARGRQPGKLRGAPVCGCRCRCLVCRCSPLGLCGRRDQRRVHHGVRPRVPGDPRADGHDDRPLCGKDRRCHRRTR